MDKSPYAHQPAYDRSDERARSAGIRPRSSHAARLHKRGRSKHPFRSWLWIRSAPRDRSCLCSCVGKQGADARLSDQFAAYLRLAAIPPHVLAPRDLFHVVLDLVAWSDRLAELGPVNCKKKYRCRLDAGCRNAK